MRVLETDPSISYKMGKNKKHRIRKAKENEAEESSEDGTGCPHVTKAVNLAAVRKVVQKPAVILGECTGCSKDGAKSTSKDLFGGYIEGPVPAESEDAETLETTICICLQCGHQGCDRNSANKHALKHYKTPHSGIHSIIVNLTTWSVWCYLCDEEVPPNPRLQSCIDYLQKESGVSKSETAQPPGRPVDSPVSEATPLLVNSPAGKHSGPSSCVKVKGLSNLGNTCFFNAVMQSLYQTRGLETLLVERSKQGRLYTIPGPEPNLDSDSCSSDEDREEELTEKFRILPPIQSNYGEPGPVTLALLNFVQEMRGGTTRNGTVNPTALFTQVCKKAPRFKGFQQQDSHELLRYLVDCIRTEEIKRGQASILKFFKLPETVNPKKVDDETKLRVKEYGRQVKHTFLDSLFGGQLVSTVKCEECKSVSQIFEAFLDLSLPVMEEKPQRPNLILIGKKKDSVCLNDGGDDADAAAAAMGLDTTVDKPNKYQERKHKRTAKKEAKKKAKLHKSKSTEHTDTAVKGDQEERTGQDQDAGSEDSNKNDNEQENAGINKENQNGSKKRSEEHSSNSTNIQGRSLSQVNQDLLNRDNRLGDSSPDGSKDGLDADEDEEKDDPSDADVEDNIESDMSRLDLSMMASGTASSHSTVNKHQSLSQSDTNTAEQSSDHVALEGMSYSVTTEVSSTTYPDEGQSSVESSSQNLQQAGPNGYIVTCNFELPKEDLPATVECTSILPGPMETSVSIDSLPKVLTNGDLNSDTPNNDTNVVDQLSSGIQQLQVTEKNATDGACISCEVSVSNSQVIELSNGVGRLTVCEGDVDENSSQTVKINGNDVITTISTEDVGEHSINIPAVNKDTEPQVSATYNFTLPNDSIGDKGGNAEGDSHPSSSGPVQHKSVDGECGDAEVQISLSDDKQHALQNVLKTQQEYLKEARNFSMSTLSPRYHPAPKECSILSCLNQFTAAELLTGSNKFGCKECTKRRRKNSHSHKAEKKGKETVYSNANKQYLIFRPPAVLTLHLKRFEQTGLTSRKVNRHVDFPLVLDLAPYCSSLCLGVKEGQTKVLYTLYAVVEHSGRLSGGHYTAYIKVRPGLGSHTQFLHNQASGAMDLLNAYLTRVAKCKVGNPAWHDGSCDKAEGGDIMDKDTESRAEALAPPGRWFHISDSRVNEVTETEVLKAQAYLLFYERIF